MNLEELQRRMSHDVRRPLTEDFAMQPATEDGTPTAEVVSQYIKPNPQLSSFERLEIYNRQYWFRVIGAVSEDYPALNAVLGSKRFDALVLAYLEATPSTSFTLRDLGARLPAWLEEHPDFATPKHVLAVDVARLEWAYIEAFDGASLPPLSPDEFAQLLPSTVLSLQPHLQLLELRYPVDEVVLAVHANTPESDIASNAVTQHKTSDKTKLPKIKRSPTYLAVHRFEDTVYYRRVEREQFLLLAALRDGHSIEDAVQIALAESSLEPQAQAETVHSTFAHATQLGWILGPSTSPTADDPTVQ